jgi:hypothetical protein
MPPSWILPVNYGTASSAMLGQKVDIFIMAGKRKQLSNDITNVIVEMRKSGYKLQEITDTLNIPTTRLLYPFGYKER